jgi:hypothetical protein
MAQQTFTSHSPDQAVMQQLFWDPVIDSIRVVHEINLTNNMDARLARKIQYKEGDPLYKEKCDEYEIDSRVKIKPIITEYEYESYPVDRDFCILATYPAIGSYYLLSGLPHHVVVTLTHTGGGVSKTSGEALPD